MYKPPSTNETVFPFELTNEQKRLQALESVTSGQINGKLSAIARRAQFDSAGGASTSWRVNRGGWRTCVTASFEVPDARTQAHVFTRGYAKSSAENPGSTNPDYRARITIRGSARSGVRALPFLGMPIDCWVGHSVEMDVEPGETFTVVLDYYCNGSAVSLGEAQQAAINFASLDAFVIYK